MSLSLVNSVFRTASRVLPVTTRSVGFISTPVTRSLWHLCKTSSNFGTQDLSLNNKHSLWGHSCNCVTCSARRVHTKGDKELIEFLSDEIAAEKKNQKGKIPTNLDGFEIKTNGAEVSLSKKFNDEEVQIAFNVNHSVDADMPEAEVNARADNPPDAQMKSKPQFEVKLVKSTQTLRFACSFIQDIGAQGVEDDAVGDIFTIDEVTIYESGPNEQTYAVAGDILDGYMYDLLMNLLEERGVSNEFSDKLSNLATKYEHSLYVNLLENMQKFIQTK